MKQMKKLDYKKLGLYIKQIRCKRGNTQEQISELADISLSHMSNVENGRTKVSLPTLFDIANALEVTVDELLMGQYDENRRQLADTKKMDILIEKCDSEERQIVIETVASLIESLEKRKNR